MQVPMGSKPGTLNPFPHSKHVTSLSLLHDLLTIWLQKLHTAVATPTHFYALKATNLSIFMRAKYQERDLDISHWMQLFVVVTTCFWKKCKGKLKHALTCSMW